MDPSGQPPSKRAPEGLPGVGWSLPLGELLAGRFLIVSPLGRGGIAEVYEAEDLELRIHVALKVLRAELAEDDRVLERFRREVLLARRVSHPNVCRVFDFYHQRPPAQREVAFVTMELLAGETLAVKLRREGRLLPRDCLPLVRDMAEALHAAHAAGVVHRDFKSGNVMLVPGPSGEIRAVVTDFGLAQSLGLATGSLTGAGGFVGTSAYMAPEQAEGRVATAATDIYALGVVMYEMVTGTRPFTGDSPVAIALKRLREPPPSPRRAVPDLPAQWEKVILRCLERDGSRRFTLAPDVVAALQDETGSAARAQDGAWRRRWLGAVLVSSLLAGAAGAYLYFSTRDPSVPTADEVGAPARPVPARRSVAVLGFRNLSRAREQGWLSDALAEMFRTELAAGEKLRMIPGENIARMKRDLSLSDTDALGKDTLVRVREYLGTDLVVLGSYLAIGAGARGRLRLDLRIQDTAAGETTGLVAESGSEEELFELVSRAGAQLRQKLALGELSAADRQGMLAALPGNARALRLYSDGLARLRQLDAQTARDLLEQAERADPAYSLARAALAEAWAALGDDARAERKAKEAFDLSASLPLAERLWVEGQYRERRRDWAEAVHAYHLLWTTFPDNVEYGLRLAAAQTASGGAKEALNTVGTLARSQGTARQDPRVDLAEVEAAAALSDYERVLQAAARAAQKGNAQGARLVIARARFREGWALTNLGRLGPASAAFEQGRRLALAANDRATLAWAARDLGLVRMRMGDLAEARGLFADALAVFRSVGSRKGSAASLNGLGLVLRRQGRLSQARSSQEESLALFREIGDKAGEARLLNTLGSLAESMGDLRQASLHYERSRALADEVGEKRGIAEALDNLGALLREQGEIERAEALFQEALATNRNIRQRSSVASNLENLAAIRFDRGELAEAVKLQEEALDLRRQIGEVLGAAQTQVALAASWLQQGQAERARALGEAAREAFREKGAADDEARAQGVLSVAYLRLGEWERAWQAADAALAYSERSESQRTRLGTALAIARVRGGSPRTDAGGEALSRLRSAVAEARSSGRKRLAWDGELLLGEIEIARGETAAGRARLQSLERETRAAGVSLIADKAAAARSAAP